MVTQDYIDHFRKQGIRVINEFHGLQVYEENPELPTEFASISVEAKIKKGISVFEQYFREAVDLSLEFTYRETLAFELYGLSYFESAGRARFLTLVTAIESISENKMRSPQAVKHVEKLIELTKGSGLPNSETQSMVGSLDSLRGESIS